MKEIIVDGKEFVLKSENQVSVEGFKFCIVRTYSAGVFAGYLKRRDGKEAEILNSRRIWYWEGAASLSQLAVEGTKKPDKCKFPCIVPETLLTEVIEIIPCSEKAYQSIMAVPVWEENNE